MEERRRTAEGMRKKREGALKKAAEDAAKKAQEASSLVTGLSQRHRAPRVRTQLATSLSLEPERHRRHPQSALILLLRLVRLRRHIVQMRRWILMEARWGQGKRTNSGLRHEWHRLWVMVRRRRVAVLRITPQLFRQKELRGSLPRLSR